MESSLLLRPPLPPSISSSSSRGGPHTRRTRRCGKNFGFRLACAPMVPTLEEGSKPNYQPGAVDDLLLRFFRRKMVELRMCAPSTHTPTAQKTWDPIRRRGNARDRTSAPSFQDRGGQPPTCPLHHKVRVLISLFPPFLPELFQMLITPIGGGKLAPMMLARATALSCQWLMGRCSVISIDLPDGSSCTSGVSVERCKYLEESKCIGICINTCKLPTQTFFKNFMGVPLLMEPNFNDYSCQFKFGVPAPPTAEDKTLWSPAWRSAQVPAAGGSCRV